VSLESRARRLITDHTGSDALTIADLYARVDRALRDALRGQVWVSGEVRSFNVSSSGHCYMDLVDPRHAHDNGSPVLKVVCWSSKWRTVRSTLDQLGITLDTGMVVRVRGEAQLYKPRGTINFNLSMLDTDALLGKVAAERARLIKALVDEDLFDRNRRLPVPRLPLRIGLVASPGTEGYRDFLGRLEGSGMAFEVAVTPVQVQGRQAPAAVAAGITRLQGPDRDIVVVVRGGGSKADLATFDAERVARAIATSTTPVWTGIGHTGDQSVADELANRSFITPTECGQELARLVLEFWRSGVEAGVVAARMAGDEVARAQRGLDRGRHGMATGARSQLDRHADRLGHRAGTLRGAGRSQLDAHAHRLTTRCGMVTRAAARGLHTEDLRLDQWRRLLGAYDYQRQLERGYSVTRDASGAVVRTVTGLSPGTALRTLVSDGQVSSTVTSVEVREDNDRDDLDGGMQ